ncbi:aldo/keto reductase [Rhizobium sp. BK376]|uniref:aldo/keto reductase n=1 Tax=Rhizobium sp. BK376 TaxID=2512149 RepID=UPI00104A985E|nr:aldo/keto reductase [Rhizobium sp. BK376]TCR90734.1 aryl-alcohol dehydrogenase-like predicted oxidoreductase [Rhizobium sp. BK376]
MEMRRLGKTEISIAPIVFGGNVFGWTADEKTSYDILDAFFGAGFNTIDTADVYSRWVPGNKGGDSEEIIGKWLKKGTISRDKAIIVTKVGSDMGEGKTLKAAYILKAVEDSLRRLQTDYIDVYLSHWPDEETPHEESLGAYAKLKEQGKIRSVGCSNYDAKLLQASLDVADKAGLPRYDVLQPEYNLYERASFEGPLADLCVKEDIGVITYFSLAAGFLSGKYRTKADTEGRAREGRVAQYLDDKGMRILAALDTVSKDTSSKPAEVALAWLLRKKGVTAPIASATSLGQLDALINSAKLDLSTEAMSLLDKAGE